MYRALMVHVHVYDCIYMGVGMCTVHSMHGNTMHIVTQTHACIVCAAHAAHTLYRSPMVSGQCICICIHCTGPPWSPASAFAFVYTVQAPHGLRPVHLHMYTLYRSPMVSGQCHINARAPNLLIGTLRLMGYELDRGATVHGRHRAHLSWMRHNYLVLRKRSR